MAADTTTHISREAVLRNLDRLGISYDSLPRPPFWGPVFGYSQEAIKFTAASRVMFASASVGRPLSQPEKNAMAHYVAKSMVTLSYTPPVALGISYAFWRKGFDTYRFPLYQPKPSAFNPNKFAFLQGALAQRAWHTFRGLTYYSIAHLFVYGFLTSYSLSTFMAALETDPVFEDFRSAMKHRRGGRPLGRPAQTLPPAQGQAEEADGDQARLGQAPESGYDAETTYESPPYGRDADAPVQEPGTAPVGRATTSQRRLPQQPSSPDPAPYDDAVEDDPYVFDDASPVAASDREPGPQQSGQRGSAWDRLRRQASGSQTGPQRGGAEAPVSSWQQRRQEEETSRGSREGTSYSFSSSDEERALAKAQAQKEFDEMLERERQGGSSRS